MEPTCDIHTGNFLAGFSGKRITYCPNPGNAGDSLIAAATIQLFKRMDVEFTIVSPKVVLPAGRIVFFGGGGNLNPSYTSASTFIAANHRQAERFVLLPHTVAGHGQLLASLGENVDFFTREKISFAHCGRHLGAARLHLAEDLAFQLDLAALLALDLPSPLIMKHPGMRRRRVRQLRLTLLSRAFRRSISSVERDKLACFREDIERHPQAPPRPTRNLDVSRLFTYGTSSEFTILGAARHFLDFLTPYTHLETDRLHVCIAGALLGKRVSFHPNSYFKNEAIYNHSMRGRYPDISWMGHITNP